MKILCRHIRMHLSKTAVLLFVLPVFCSSPSFALADTVSKSALLGEWIRPDGGYALHIDKIHPDGTVDAQYLNPKKVNIQHAELSDWKGLLKLVVKLNDIGYKGSNYTLYYYEEKDALAGFYYQAQMDQTFKVVFIRKDEWLKNKR